MKASWAFSWAEAEGATEEGRSQSMQDLYNNPRPQIHPHLCELDSILTLQNREMKVRESEEGASGHTARGCLRWGWNNGCPLLQPRFTAVSPSGIQSHCDTWSSGCSLPLTFSLAPGSNWLPHSQQCLSHHSGERCCAISGEKPSSNLNPCFR